jgi:hypothetical protein
MASLSASKCGGAGFGGLTDMSTEQTMCEMALRFESIALELGGNGTLWLVKPDGEGMEVNKSHFEQWLNVYFQQNF